MGERVGRTRGPLDTIPAATFPGSMRAEGGLCTLVKAIDKPIPASLFRVPSMDDLSARYLQIAEQLRESVSEAAPNTLLPTEEQLASQFGVSRVTIRRALSLLERSGLISRTRGRGTLVSPPKLVRHLVPACTIEQDFSRQGIKLETEILSFDSASKPSEAVRRSLKLSTSETVATLVLARTVGYETICYEKRYFRTRLARKLDLSSVERAPLSEVLESLSGRRIGSSDIESEIVAASEEVGEKLKITPGTLVFAQNFTEHLDDDAALQTGMMFYRIDRIRFSIVQRGAPFSRDGGTG